MAEEFSALDGGPELKDLSPSGCYIPHTVQRIDCVLCVHLITLLMAHRSRNVMVYQSVLFL